ncbi:hypothetical protein Afil01_05860 [Actinorhabdospora filicis]|uniref:Transposase (putative) YhgA-like domain-containing protein n=1 Tax=Actinorhabdospora filicis TaxID=1785913 RepID=A0A9W6SEL0_9ACTN|nr:hypothetical protein [Actinorhabdospora filicis]GLZ75779.1 hypothetical protein Afil01_05860 [Actinorhabdospora filicis]
MVTHAHEAPTGLLKRHKELILPMLDVVGLPHADEVEIVMVSENCTEIRPTERYVDGLALLRVDGEAVMAVIVEVQLRPDKDKLRTWPRYVGDVWDRYGVPTVLLVVTPDHRTASWASAPIDVGPAGTIEASVLSPDSMPVIDDAESYEGAEDYAVLAAFIHARGDHAPEILAALGDILARSPIEAAQSYAEDLFAVLPARARKIWEKIMTAAAHEYQTGLEYMFNSGKEEGRNEAAREIKTQALFVFLDARGLYVSDEVAERIRACDNVHILDHWIRKAATVTTAEALFD